MKRNVPPAVVVLAGVQLFPTEPLELFVAEDPGGSCHDEPAALRRHHGLDDQRTRVETVDPSRSDGR